LSIVYPEDLTWKHCKGKHALNFQNTTLLLYLMQSQFGCQPSFMKGLNLTQIKQQHATSSDAVVHVGHGWIWVQALQWGVVSLLFAGIFQFRWRRKRGEKNRRWLNHNETRIYPDKMKRWKHACIQRAKTFFFFGIVFNSEDYTHHAASYVRNSIRTTLQIVSPMPRMNLSCGQPSEKAQLCTITASLERHSRNIRGLASPVSLPRSFPLARAAGTTKR